MRYIICLIFATLCQAQEVKHYLLYRVSQCVVIGANTLDTASSYGRPELNPILGSTFGPRAIAIKWSIVGSGLILEEYMRHKRPALEKPFIISNFIMGGATTGVAIRNWKH